MVRINQGIGLLGKLGMIIVSGFAGTVAGTVITGRAYEKDRGRLLEEIKAEMIKNNIRKEHIEIQKKGLREAFEHERYLRVKSNYLEAGMNYFEALSKGESASKLKVLKQEYERTFDEYKAELFRPEELEALKPKPGESLKEYENRVLGEQ